MLLVFDEYILYKKSGTNSLQKAMTMNSIFYLGSEEADVKTVINDFVKLSNNHQLSCSTCQCINWPLWNDQKLHPNHATSPPDYPPDLAKGKRFGLIIEIEERADSHTEKSCYKCLISNNKGNYFEGDKMLFNEFTLTSSLFPIIAYFIFFLHQLQVWIANQFYENYM